MARGEMKPIIGLLDLFVDRLCPEGVRASLH
jgi:hypothetical protein